MSKKLKIIIAIVITLVVIFFAVKYFSKPNNTGNNLVSVESSSAILGGENQLSQANEILSILSLLNKIKLNTDFFSKPTFKSLNDFSVELPIPQKGKSNPFSP